MASIKSQLRSFFLAGGTGTNAQLAARFECSQPAIRKAVMQLRDAGIPIERPVFPLLGFLAVYRLSDAYYAEVNPTEYQDYRLGRPAHSQRLM